MNKAMPSVFLSPSTQEWNPYVNGGNEEEYMNLIADKMEPYLRSSGISFGRNNPSRGVTGAIAESNAGNYDVHLAMHSNAAGGDFVGKLRGIDIYYSPYSDLSRQLAVITEKNLKFFSRSRKSQYHADNIIGRSNKDPRDSNTRRNRISR